jgi:hypothetical protein
MQVTRIRTKAGKFLTDKQYDRLVKEILSKTKRAGFETDCARLTKRIWGTDKKGYRKVIETLPLKSISIGMGFSCFRIIPKIHEYNGRMGHYIDSPKGYTRTTVPTWDQRVEFNDLINDIFDAWKLSARIKSGPYLVRSRQTGRRDESDWSSEDPTGMQGDAVNGMGQVLSRIRPEEECREECNSDQREAEHKALIRLKNQERRAYLKTLKNASKLSVTSKEWVKGDYVSKTVEMKPSQYFKLIKSLPKWERKRITVEVMS